MHLARLPDSTRAALKIAAIYLVISVLWIVFSDRGVSLLFKDPEMITLAQTFKGWAFVCVTALLIFVLLKREIQAYLRIMKRLQRSGQELRDLLDAMPVGVALTDGLTIEYINVNFSERFGYTLDEIPTVEHWFLLAYPDPQYREPLVASWQADLARAGSEGRPVPPYDVRVTCRSGEVRQVIIHTQLIGDRILVIMIDITEREMLKNEVAKIQKLESIGVLAGGIAHDFNNILTGIMGNISYLQLLLPPADDARQPLDAAMKGTARAAELTRQLLTFARGGQPLKQAVAVGELLHECLNLMLSGTRVKGELILDEPVSAIEADAGQISQVLNNIIINAVQAMPEGGRMRVSATDCRLDEGNTLALPAGDYVRISLADTGCGMPPETLAHIFDPFFSTKAGGSGLGLASAYSIVTRHGGSIIAQSEPGRGTTFLLHLPASSEQPAGSAPSDPARGRQSSRRHRILVMDDEEAICSIAATMLSHLGYAVQTCADGQAAIDLYRQARSAGRPFSAVIMDLTVPGAMGGIEAAAAIRDLDPAARLVVSSGYSHDPIMSEYRDHGFAAVLAKPYLVNDLERVLLAVLADGEQLQAAPV